MVERERREERGQEGRREEPRVGLEVREHAVQGCCCRRRSGGGEGRGGQPGGGSGRAAVAPPWERAGGLADGGC